MYYSAGQIYSLLQYFFNARIKYFLNQEYDVLFKVLFPEPKLKSLVSPFEAAYKSGAVDQ